MTDLEKKLSFLKRNKSLNTKRLRGGAARVTAIQFSGRGRVSIILVTSAT